MEDNSCWTATEAKWTLDSDSENTLILLICFSVRQYILDNYVQKCRLIFSLFRVLHLHIGSHCSLHDIWLQCSALHIHFGSWLPNIEVFLL